MFVCSSEIGPSSSCLCERNLQPQAPRQVGADSIFLAFLTTQDSPLGHRMVTEQSSMAFRHFHLTGSIDPDLEFLCSRDILLVDPKRRTLININTPTYLLEGRRKLAAWSDEKRLYCNACILENAPLAYHYFSSHVGKRGDSKVWKMHSHSHDQANRFK